MNCKPGDLARIVDLHPALSEVRDRIVQLTDEPPVMQDGEAYWRLTKRVDFVLTGNGRRGDANFYIGESVWFDMLQDRLLRPIRNPGDDAVDESKAWLPPVPLPAIDPSLIPEKETT